MRLSTAVQSVGRDALAEKLDTDKPLFGQRDWRGVEFTPVESRVTLASTLPLAGHVTATDPVDFTQIAHRPVGKRPLRRRS